MKRALTAAAVLFAAAAFGESAGGLTWKAPSGWKVEGQRPMRAATYKIPAVKGDAEDAEVAVFYFGAGQGGGVDENVKRWVGQFEQPDGKPSDAAAKTKKDKVAGMPVTFVDLSGTYMASMGPMSPTKTSKPGYRLVGAIVEGPNGNIFFKLTGPAKTVDGAKKDFDKMVAAIAK